MNETTMVPASPMVRFESFISAYMAAPDDDEFEIRVAKIGPSPDEVEDGLAIRVAGVDHGFTLAEAAEVANIAESTLREFPDFPETRSLPNLILALRHGCELITKQAEQAAKKCQCAACAVSPHASDYSVHNEPAYPNGPCDCGAAAKGEG